MSFQAKTRNPDVSLAAYLWIPDQARHDTFLASCFSPGMTLLRYSEEAIRFLYRVKKLKK